MTRELTGLRVCFASQKEDCFGYWASQGSFLLNDSAFLPALCSWPLAPQAFHTHAVNPSGAWAVSTPETPLLLPTAAVRLAKARQGVPTVLDSTPAQLPQRLTVAHLLVLGSPTAGWHLLPPHVSLVSTLFQAGVSPAGATCASCVQKWSFGLKDFASTFDALTAPAAAAAP